MRFIAIGLLIASAWTVGCSGPQVFAEDGGTEASVGGDQTEGGAPDGGVDSALPDTGIGADTAPAPPDTGGDTSTADTDAGQACEGGSCCTSGDVGCNASTNAPWTCVNGTQTPGPACSNSTCNAKSGLCEGNCAPEQTGCNAGQNAPWTCVKGTQTPGAVCVNATCTEANGEAPSCVCKPGYSGDPCTPIDSCAIGHGGCDPNATCTSTGPGTNTCTCNTGYTGNGTSCTGVLACDTNNGGCSAKAVCTNTGPGTRTCTCEPGYSGNGLDCTAIDSCALNHGNCDPNATCTSTGPGTNSCTCNSGYTGNGATCTGINACATNNGGCADTAKCTSTGPGKATCACNPGYSGDGYTCTPVDACLTANGGCSSNATCKDTGPGTVSCTCNPGYSGTGTTCSPIDSCLTNHGGCDAHATCTSTGAGTNSCACNAGYAGNGTSCTPINSCATSSGGCDANATCTSTGAGTNSCACNAGYAGNGTSCTPINSCATSNGGCDAHATCTSTGAGTNSCACNTGYAGSGTSCTPINSCATGNGGCDVHATCTSTGAGTNSCACISGYAGNGTSCTPINSCATGNGGCDVHATCTSTGAGTNSCACISGYAGNGTSCTPINSCATGNGGCDANATCTSTGPGTNSCTCNPGYTGNGTSCTALETLTFTMSFIGAADASVTTTPASSINCTGPCSMSAQFSAGAPVIVTANVAPGNLFHWTGACTGSNATCALTMKASATLNLIVSHNNYMFVSSQPTSNGNLGGLTGADQICQTFASNAGLPGTYQALLAVAAHGDAGTATNLTSRLDAAGARGWVRVDGQPFVDQPSDITSGQLQTAPNVDEYGSFTSWDGVEAWTGAAVDGTPAGNDCAGFTSTATAGQSGFSDTTEWDWYASIAGVGCSQNYLSLYCFGTTLNNPLVYAKPPGRIAFLSKAAFDTSQGLSGGAPNTTTGSADVLCQTEAESAGLSGTYLALLATTHASPASRFNTTGPTWVRPDGMPLAASALSFMQMGFSSTKLGASDLITSISQHADGTFASNADFPGDSSFVRTGAHIPAGPAYAPLTTAASALTDSCDDWQASGTTGSVGQHGLSNFEFFAYSNALAAGCGATLPIYCLQK